MSNSGVLFVFSAALLWGISGGIAGLLIDSDWSALTVSFYRGAIGLLFVLAWLLLRPAHSGLSNPRLWFWSVLAGLGVAGNFAFYFLSIDQSSVAVAATLMYCAPVFVFLVSFALRLEQPTLLKWVAIVIVMAGIVLLTRIYEVDGANISLLGVITGLMAGISLTLFIFAFKYATAYGSPQAILLVAFATLIAVFTLFIDQGETKSALNSADLPIFFVLGLLGGGASFFLYLIGLRHTLPAVASIVAMVEPVTASLFGVLVLSESLVYTQIIGMALILITVTALGASQKHNQ